jgi:hypothetical protein
MMTDDELIIEDQPEKLWFNDEGVGYYLQQFDRTSIISLLEDIDSFSQLNQFAILMSLQSWPLDHLGHLVYPRYINSSSIAVWLKLNEFYATEEVKTFISVFRDFHINFNSGEDLMESFRDFALAPIEKESSFSVIPRPRFNPLFFDMTNSAREQELALHATQLALVEED